MRAIPNSAEGYPYRSKAHPARPAAMSCEMDMTRLFDADAPPLCSAGDVPHEQAVESGLLHPLKGSEPYINRGGGQRTTHDRK